VNSWLQVGAGSKPARRIGLSGLRIDD